MRMTRICTDMTNDDANKNHNPNYTNEYKFTNNTNKIQNSNLKIQNDNSKCKMGKFY
jgi:hypothetical protein